MGSRTARIVGCLSSIWLASPAALAQPARHGAIVGHVSGQTGRPLAGIKVMASSPSQTGPAKIAYSDDKGTFRLLQLRPGTVELRFTGADLKTLVRRGVLVTPAAPTEVRVTMEVEIGGGEEVRSMDPLPLPARHRASGTHSNGQLRRRNEIIRAGRGSGDTARRHAACSILAGRSRHPR